VALSLALVTQPGMVAKRLGGGEAGEDDLIGGTRAHARRALIVYGVITAAGVAVLMLVGLNFFRAVLYSLAAVSTGGFAPDNASLGALGAWHRQALVILLCVAGATPLAVYSRLYRKKGRFNVELLQLGALVVAGLIVSIVLGALLWARDGATAGQAVRQAPLLAFSAQTTAGFANINPAHLDAASKVVLCIAMVIGGGTGSTAGGFKLLRLLIILRVLQVMIARSSLAATR
jgi:trk/ktr system potassium uptake protein